MSGTNGSNYAGNNISYDGLTNYDLITAVDLASAEIAAATIAANAAAVAANTPLYMGALASDPGLNLNGGALVAGNLYYNTAYGELRTYSGTSWANTNIVGLAPLSSPAFTGFPTAPNATALSNDTQIATTSYTDTAVAAASLAMLSNTAPIIDGTAAVGVSLLLARQDHVHPTDTTRAPLASPTFTGTPVMPAAFVTALTTDNAPTPSTDYLLYYNATDGGLRKATVASVSSAGASGVTTFDGRSGAVTPTTGDYTVAQVTGAAPLASPALTGTPTAPTATAGTNSTRLATTAYSDAATGALTSAVSSLTTLAALAAPLASPALTGTPTAPTAAVDTNTTQLATTAMVLAQAASSTPLIDATSAVVGVSTRFARGDHVHPTDTSRAPLFSPALTGTPTAPTAPGGTNTTQVATTAFVLANLSSGGYTQIAQTVISASPTTVAFTSIPQTYSDLVLVWTALLGATGTQSVYLDVSTNNGSTYSSNSVAFTTASNSAYSNGFGTLEGYSCPFGRVLAYAAGGILSSPEVITTTGITAMTAHTGGCNALRLRIPAFTFASGTVTLYGR